MNLPFEVTHHRVSLTVCPVTELALHSSKTHSRLDSWVFSPRFRINTSCLSIIGAVQHQTHITIPGLARLASLSHKSVTMASRRVKESKPLARGGIVDGERSTLKARIAKTACQNTSSKCKTRQRVRMLKAKHACCFSATNHPKRQAHEADI